MRIIKNHLFWICIIVLDIGLYAQEEAIIEKDINIGLQQMHYCIIGDGSPTLILDVGIGNTYRDWLPFLKRVTKKFEYFVMIVLGMVKVQRDPCPETAKQKWMI